MSANELNHNKNGDVAAEEVENTKAVNNAASAIASKAEPSADVAVAASAISPTADNKKTPVKRTPSKRMSFIERAQKESEELVRTMGGNLQMEGGRRTRSSMRGTPTSTATVSPPPSKKARNSPSTTTPSKGRGRGRKLDTTNKTPELADNTEESNKPAVEKTAEKTLIKGKSKKHIESIEEENVVNNNDVAKETKETSESTVGVENDQTDSTVAEETTKETTVESPAKEDISDVVKNNVDNVKQSTDEKAAESTPMETEDKAEIADETVVVTEQEKTETLAEAMEVDSAVEDNTEQKSDLVEEKSNEHQNDTCKKDVAEIEQDKVDTNDVVVAAVDDDNKVTESAAEVPVANNESILPSETIEATKTNSEIPTIANDDNLTETQSNKNGDTQENETDLESINNNVADKPTETIALADDSSAAIKVQKEQSEDIKHATTNETSVSETTAGGGA